MPFLQLQPHVSFALLNERPIFLDLRRDRYLALEGRAARAFDELRLGRGRTPGIENTEALLRTGLFVPATDPCRLAPADVTAPASELSGMRQHHARLFDFLESWILLRAAARALRSEPLHAIIASRRQRPIARIRSAETGFTLAARFRRARAWVPVEPSCFQDSLALGDWLARRGVRSMLVLGVKMDPFAAHCWVQLDGVLLNDACETVAAFTPILAVP